MLQEHEIFMYISRWAFMGGAPGLQVYKFNTETGAVTFLKDITTEISFGFSRVDEERGFLYLVNEMPEVPGVIYKTGRIYGYRLDKETGDATELFHQETYCPFPSYIGMSADKNYIVVPHHSWADNITTVVKNGDGIYEPMMQFNDSCVNLYTMNADGTLGKLVDVKKHSFATPHFDFAGKLTIPHPHSAVLSPSGKFFAVCDKGDGHIYFYTINEETQKLELLARHQTDADLSEPRYCVFHPTKPFIYVNHEHTADGSMPVNAYRYTEEGNLAFINKVDTLYAPCYPADGKKALTSLSISNDGQYLYCVANGCNNVGVFSIDQETGAIALIQNQPINGKKARNGALSPNGRYFITACILDGEIDVFAVGEDGMLTPTEHHAKAHGAAYISFYDPKKTK